MAVVLTMSERSVGNSIAVIWLAKKDGSATVIGAMTAGLCAGFIITRAATWKDVRFVADSF